ncbi:hypothetical protein BFP72_17920 [Reichenbachiella sp. 5M10]|uniref:DUF4286 family protein n=1 Tax=Reichenbachiella sp. 5M10 TaxID=1889772 RepID=UPI000C1489B6|nr:DUF4286 family protein [Reichenbachiella sp. 5M10]PIB37150.1 hypothetical protein BFP72_17920 [Reichenbachiella sp. 5M10]
MVLYNVTMNVDKRIESDWLQWMKTIHIEKMIATGHFVECKVFELLSDEPQGTTYSVQFFAKNEEDILAFQESLGEQFHHEIISKYGDSVMLFRTMLKQVH